jgi:hypothetical protein
VTGLKKRINARHNSYFVTTDKKFAEKYGEYDHENNAKQSTGTVPAGQVPYS